MTPTARQHALDGKRSQFLGLLAGDTPIDEVLTATCHAIEAQVRGARASILRCALDGGHLHGGVAPSMDPAYIAGLDGLPVGPGAGSCGTAAHRRERVIVRDVFTDPLWDGLGEMARANEIGACWSEPILTPQGEVIGTFAIYRSAPGVPDDAEIMAVGAFVDLIRLALQKERRRKARLAAGQRLTNLMQNIPGTVLQWSWAASGRIAITYASDGITDMTGLDADTVMRHPRHLLRRIPVDERRQLIKALRQSVEDMTPVRWDFSIRQNDGSRKWARLVSRPIRDDDGNVVSDALGLDITDRHESEMRAQESHAELNDRLIELERTKARHQVQSSTLMEAARELTMARDQAEEANRTKSEFLSNMTHELRTPLNAIIGFSDIIMSETFGPVGNERYRIYAEDINSSGSHLLELINEILDYAKLESGRDSLFEEDFSICDVVETVSRMFAHNAEQSGVKLSILVPDDLPDIHADQRKLRQILINLLSNAIKFTKPDGHVTLTIWHRPESGFVFQVVDTGIGISLSDIPKALGVFGQIDNAFSRSREGTGLGLPLTKALCEMHGGSLDLQSQVGVGTTVTIRFPPERVVAASQTGQPEGSEDAIDDGDEDDDQANAPAA